MCQNVGRIVGATLRQGTGMSVNRRSFCAGLGTLAGYALSSQRGWGAESSLRHSRWQAFGTQVNLAFHCESSAVADELSIAARQETRLVERLLSIYEPDSQLARLNRFGHIQRPHAYLRYLLDVADQYGRETRGAFDVTVQPLWTLFQKTREQQTFPTTAEIKEVKRRVSRQNIVRDSSSIELRNDAELTLNGIAQGFATDRIKHVLLRYGVQHACVDVGELAAMGDSSDDSGWRVGIQHPRHDDAFLAVGNLRGRCLATSGDYATSFTEDFRSHHIFDPATGESPAELASVSVLAPSAMAADAISTALMVMGIERGERYLRRKRNVDAMFVRKDGRVLRTEGFAVGRESA